MKHISIEIHPIFEPINKNFRYFFVSMNMMALPVLQSLLIKSQPDLEKMPALQLSVKVEEFNTLFYLTKRSIEEFNQDTNLRRLDNGLITCDINALLIPYARMMAISIYDILYSSKYNKKINQDKTVFFAKCLRNGASHDNKFKFTHKELEKLPVEWRGKVLTKDFNGKKVFNDFILPTDLIILMHDLSKIMK